MAKKSIIPIEDYNAALGFLGKSSLFLLGMSMVVAPVFQGLIWLKTGHMPDVDLFWLLEETCNPYDPYGCHRDSMVFTSWAGLNQVLREIFEWHIAISTGCVLIVFWIVFFTLAVAIITVYDAIENLRS